MALSVPIDTREITLTPVFRHQTVEDVPASEREGSPVMKTIEVVEVRFAGSKLYSPVFPVHAFWKRDGHKTITYAERWADQYRAFLEGADQVAAGTPLEMLKSHGISPAQLSLCRALKIYSIESLYHLEGQNLKNLGMAANDLKRMAKAFMDDRSSGAASKSEIDALRAEIERLRSSIPAAEPTSQEISQAIEKSDSEFEAWDDELLKEYIKEKTGKRPLGNPSHATLVSMASDVAA